MLNTFDENNNEMMLAAIQELTADLATAQSKIAELEKGGGGGGDVYLTSNADGTYTIQQRIPETGDFVISYSDEGDYIESRKRLISDLFIFDPPIVATTSLLNYDGTTISDVECENVAEASATGSIYKYNNRYYKLARD